MSDKSAPLFPCKVFVNLTANAWVWLLPCNKTKKPHVKKLMPILNKYWILFFNFAIWSLWQSSWTSIWSPRSSSERIPNAQRRSNMFPEQSQHSGKKDKINGYRWDLSRWLYLEQPHIHFHLANWTLCEKIWSKLFAVGKYKRNWSCWVTSCY